MKVQWMWGKRIEIWRDFISNNGKIASCGTALPLRTTRKDGWGQGAAGNLTYIRELVREPM